MASSQIFRGVVTELKSTTNPSVKTFWLIQDSGARIKVIAGVTEPNFADGAEVEVTGILNVEGEVEAQFVRLTNQGTTGHDWRRWVLRVVQAYTWLLPILMMKLTSAAIQAIQHPTLRNGILNGPFLMILVMIGSIPTVLSVVLSAVVYYKNRTVINIVPLFLSVVSLLYVCYALFVKRP